jgi:HEAT repeat protein
MMIAVSLTRRPVAELVREALSAQAAGDDNRRWDIISHLHRYGGERALRIAARLCRSQVGSHRVLGADILGQLGATLDRPASQGPYRQAAVATLLAIVESEDQTDVLVAVGVAFGHLQDERCIAPLARLRTHPDPEVRHAVVMGLLGSSQSAAVDTLVELSDDPNAHVRDWATFGLARQTDTDSEQVRSALVASMSGRLRWTPSAAT